MRFLPTLAIAGLFLLIPRDVWAWGPAAHLDFGLHALTHLALIAPAIAALLKNHRDDYLYGNLAADITIGKNLSPYQLHCHNWQVALPVLELAENESTQAFAWGYLSHLAADSVAHNYFVPYKTVENFHRRGAAHTYWELRYDSMVDPVVWPESRRLSSQAFPKHDSHLGRILTGPLFPFKINKQIFNSMVQFTRLRRWRKAIQAHARRSPRVLTAEQFHEARTMCCERVLDLLTYGQEALCLQSDPTGHRNLLIAMDLRKRLRALRREGLLGDPETVGQRFRPLFREAIESKLILPSLDELCMFDGLQSEPLIHPTKRGLLSPMRMLRRYESPNASSEPGGRSRKKARAERKKERQKVRAEKKQARAAKKTSGAQKKQKIRVERKTAKAEKKQARAQRKQTRRAQIKSGSLKGKQSKKKSKTTKKLARVVSRIAKAGKARRPKRPKK